MLERARLFVLPIALAMLTGCPENNPAPPAPSDSPAPAADEHAHEHEGEHNAIREIMQTLNKGSQSPTKQIGRALESDPVDWQTISSLMPQYVELAGKLPDTAPPQGPQASWQGLAKGYAEAAKALQSAVEIESADSANAAYTTLTNSCKTCHDIHRP